MPPLSRGCVVEGMASRVVRNAAFIQGCRFRGSSVLGVPADSWRRNSVASRVRRWCPGHMDVTWLDPDRLDPHLTAGAAAVREAVRALDTPQLPSETTTKLTADVRYGWDGDLPLIGVAHADGRVAAVVWIDLPHWDNNHVGQVNVEVDPIARRRGLGRKLLDIGIERVRA